MILCMLCEDGDLSDLTRRGYASEWKHDGTRVLVIKEKGKVTLQNRDGIDYTRRLTEMVTAAEEIPGDFIIDTEAVYVNPETGREEFTPSQRRCSTQDWAKILWLRERYPITGMAFDILSHDGNVETLPYLKRKALLERLLDGHEGVLQFVQHRFDLAKHWDEVKQREGEGLILKDINSRYEHKRSYSWLKVKNWRFQVGEVVGFTAGKNSRAWFFGALVLAKDGKFIGTVGGGFNDWELRQVKDILTGSPKVDKPFDIGEPYTAVKTDLKVEVKYYQITENNVMRFPVFWRVADKH